MQDLKQVTKLLIESLVGQANRITIQSEVVRFFGGDYCAAAFFEQLIYWTSRATLPDNQVAKTYQEWEEELVMSEEKIRRIVKKYPQFVSTKVHKFKGNPTVHYQFHADVFYDALMHFLQDRSRQNDGNQADKMTDSGATKQGEPYTETTQTLQTEIYAPAKINELFGQWYELYPRKKGREAARAAYCKVVSSKSATPDELMNGLKFFLAEIALEKQSARFIKHPATWLNQGCWNDEYQTDLPKSPETNPSTQFIDQKINKPMHGLYRANKDMFVIIEQGILIDRIGADGAIHHANNEKLPIYDDQLEEGVLQLLREEYKRMKEGDKR